MANETILIVDADTKSQKVLEVSFKKAGYRVVMTDGPKRARELVQDTSPDIIISDTAFPNGGDGFDFLADLKSGGARNVPFIFLTEERSLPQKMRGFELGADDYLTKPIYIKEVTTRVELLLQKRAKESLTDEDIEELEGSLADITMIDLLQTIEEELRSGTIHLTSELQSAVIYFREGNILDAICGKLQGEEAIYRLMLWPDGEFVLRYHDQVRRVDRIEKDSGALLLEGIRRLDRYNELLDELPNLGRIFVADFERLTRLAEMLPDEVGRVVRLFDGLRTIREVCDGSPLDDVTTLKVVRRLIEDDLISDVTPESGSRPERKTRSNLAAWLEGARGEVAPKNPYVREDTSPKFGSSITEMVEKRSTDRHEQAERKTLDGPFLATPFDDDDDDDDVVIDPRRQTHMQWDIRPRSGWNIQFDDSGANSGAAIREIEEEERQRRELEARQLQSGRFEALPAEARTSGERPRESTLPFTSSVSRQPPSQDDDLIRDIEEDERRRRDEEARRLQAELQSLQAREPLAPAPRRSTDELPVQTRNGRSLDEDSFDTPPSMFGADPGPNKPPRERLNTPLSAPAFVSLEDRSIDPVSDEFDLVSEADAFEDDSDEMPRSERSTLDLRPPTPAVKPESATKLEQADAFDEPAPLDAGDLDPGDLFDLASDATAPLDEEEAHGLAEISLEELPAVERQARDRELVHTEYDLSRRRSVAPAEISGDPPSWERETVELPKGGAIAADSSSEQAFFSGDAPPLFEDDESADRGTPIGWIVGLLALAAVVVVVLVVGSEPPAEDVEPQASEPVAVKPTPPAEPVPAEPAPEELGLDAPAATEAATAFGTSVSAGSQELAAIMSGEVPGLVELDAGTTPEEAPGDEVAMLQAAQQPEAQAAEEQAPMEEAPREEAPEQTAPEETAPEETAPKEATGSDAEVREARSLVKREKYDEALDLLRKLSKAAPKNKEVAYLHGIAAFNSNRTGEAIESLSRAERLGQRTARLYLELAAAYQLDRKPDKAKWAYEKFLALQPEGRQADEVRSILSTQF